MEHLTKITMHNLRVLEPFHSHVYQYPASFHNALLELFYILTLFSLGDA